jgi:hypothetical protein
VARNGYTRTRIWMIRPRDILFPCCSGCACPLHQQLVLMAEIWIYDGTSLQWRVAAALSEICFRSVETDTVARPWEATLGLRAIFRTASVPQQWTSKLEKVARGYCPSVRTRVRSCRLSSSRQTSRPCGPPCAQLFTDTSGPSVSSARRSVF